MVLERWLNNNLGLLTAEKFKVFYGLLKFRWVRWLTAGAHRAVTVMKQDGDKVSKCFIPLSL